MDIHNLQRRTFQDWVIRKPVKLGGLGLRTQADLSQAAFIGAVEKTLLSFIGELGICPPLAHLVGNMDNVNERCRTWLDSGCRTGVELANAWETVQSDARWMVEFLW